MFTVGVQLYTLRHKTQTLEDFAETLKRVADMGYQTVQVSGTCDYTPEWLRDILKETGLRCVITHFSPERIENAPADVAEEHRVFGCRYIGLGGTPGGIDKEGGYETLCRIVRKAGEPIAKAGGQLTYHNHDREFTRETPHSKPYLYRMVEDFTPQQLGITLDTYWVQAGGASVVKTIRDLSGRVDCVHLKDMIFDGGQKMAPVGSGNMDFEGILSALKEAGTKYALVEQDDCYGEDPFLCLEASYRYLSSLGLK